MNIIYHHRTQGTGAEGVHIAFVIKGLRKLGHNVTVVSPNKIEPSITAGDNPFAKTQGNLKRKLLSALSKTLPQFCFELMEMAYNYYAYPKLKTAVKKDKAGLIYERLAFFMTAGAKIAKEQKIPYIIEVNELAGHKRLREQVFVKWARESEQKIFCQADAIIVVSQFLKDDIEQLGINPDKVHVIPNGADEEMFDPLKYERNETRNKYGIPADSIVFGFIGWFVAWHNLEWFIEQFSVLKNENVRFCLIGDGPLKEKFKLKAQECGIADKLMFIGAVPYSEIPAHINMLDVGVIPGSNEYRSPIKMFEYMIMGKPVIAPRYQPIESIISNYENGMLFDKENQNQLKEALQQLTTNPSLREKLGNDARKKILNEHLWVHNAGKVGDMMLFAARLTNDD